MKVNRSILGSVPVSVVSDDLKLAFQPLSELSNSILIEPLGSINSCNAVYFEKRIITLIGEEYIHLVFNMRNTNYVSAVGIRSFIHLLKKVKKIGGNIILDRLQSNVLEIFQLPGFIDIFTINSEINYADPDIAEKDSAGSDLRDFKEKDILCRL